MKLAVSLSFVALAAGSSSQPPLTRSAKRFRTQDHASREQVLRPRVSEEFEPISLLTLDWLYELITKSCKEDSFDFPVFSFPGRESLDGLANFSWNPRHECLDYKELMEFVLTPYSSPAPRTPSKTKPKHTPDSEAGMPPFSPDSEYFKRRAGSISETPKSDYPPLRFSTKIPAPDFSADFPADEDLFSPVIDE